MAATAKDEELHPDEEAVLGNGTSIEERAAAGENEDEEDGQFLIPGTGSGLTLNAGGRKPGTSEAKMAAIPLAIKGEFKKGDTVRLFVDCVVQDVHFPDEYKNGEIVRTRRVHMFRPVAVEPVDPVVAPADK